MTQQKIEYVSLIEELKGNQQPTGFYKIVKTSSRPEERLAQLRTSSTYDLEVYSLIRCLDSSGVEKDLHRKFKDFKNFQSKRKGREWFDFRNYNIHEVVEEINSSVKDTAPPEPGDSKGNPIVGALLLLPLLGIVIINNQPSLTKDQRNYHAANNVFSSKNMDAFEQYTQAQEKFQKLADSSSHKCVKKYGEDMVAVIYESKTFLRSTGGDYRQAWKLFESLREQVWPKQPVCKKIMDDIDKKNN
ncbi:MULTISPECIES: GIY-YIG nuclease family protein [unclassified Moorena]|uniref:GIY-YIG nuclease family protein n=1 Tax=unclassified Moorena TaxID=2683338 RepID=UPI0013B9626C|nr:MULTISPECIES: GIY-YIG nuclease family protein [unclassified Moorena]NER90029.1 GIY-YIG nuclease family protein [Moorena sp. SIO3A2]NET69277.1 GIY-YIG nuclease family protein [Moorena sp. SIO1G6]